MTVLFATHPAFAEHVTSPSHPERPARLEAVVRATQHPALVDAVQPLVVRPASDVDLQRVHPVEHLAALRGISEAGGGWIDGDTQMSSGSWHAAQLGAGAGLSAVEALQGGEGDGAFCAVRPPGHHATREQAMGFCLLSNVAVVAAALAEQGERVVIVDIDAHHGNGTQDVFYGDGRVLYVSLHQWPLYPGTGSLTETGSGAGSGTTLNVPLPPGTTATAYLQAIDEVIFPVASRFAPTWLVLSAGFDAHRADPITDLGLSAADYAAIVRRLLPLAPRGRRIAMLEGGYDLTALQRCTEATLAALAGVDLADPLVVAGGDEAPTSGDVGRAAVDRVVRQWTQGEHSW